MNWVKVSEQMPPACKNVLLFCIAKEEHVYSTMYFESIRLGYFNSKTSEWNLYCDSCNIECIPIGFDKLRVTRWSEIDLPEEYDLAAEFDSAWH